MKIMMFSLNQISSFFVFVAAAFSTCGDGNISNKTLFESSNKAVLEDNSLGDFAEELNWQVVQVSKDISRCYEESVFATATTLLDISVTDDGTIWVLSQSANSELKSISNERQTWKAARLPKIGRYAPSGIGFASEDAGAIVLRASSLQSESSVKDSALIETKDGGKTWTEPAMVRNFDGVKILATQKGAKWMLGNRTNGDRIQSILLYSTPGGWVDMTPESDKQTKIIDLSASLSGDIGILLDNGKVLEFDSVTEKWGLAGRVYPYTAGTMVKGLGEDYRRLLLMAGSRSLVLSGTRMTMEGVYSNLQFVSRKGESERFHFPDFGLSDVVVTSTSVIAGGYMVDFLESEGRVIRRPVVLKASLNDLISWQVFSAKSEIVRLATIENTLVGFTASGNAVRLGCA